MNLINLSKIADKYAIFCALFENRIYAKLNPKIKGYFYNTDATKPFFIQKHTPLELK
jgi:hypothetical protein